MTIDEMLIPFKGRCSFIQYIANKPAKYGIKVFALCDSETFYVSGLEVYCGKQPEDQYMVSNSALDIVNRLVEPYKNENRNLTVDKQKYFCTYLGVKFERNMIMTKRIKSVNEKADHIARQLTKITPDINIYHFLRPKFLHLY